MTPPDVIVRLTRTRKARAPSLAALHNPRSLPDAEVAFDGCSHRQATTRRGLYIEEEKRRKPQKKGLYTVFWNALLYALTPNLTQRVNPRHVPLHRSRPFLPDLVRPRPDAVIHCIRLLSLLTAAKGLDSYQQEESCKIRQQAWQSAGFEVQTSGCSCLIRYRRSCLRCGCRWCGPQGPPRSKKHLASSI